MGFFDTLKNGLAKTRRAIVEQINNVFSAFKHIDDDLYDELEETLIMADVGVTCTEEMLGRLKAAVKEKHITEPEAAKKELFSIMENLVTGGSTSLSEKYPLVILVIGVNGVGKTTSIGKIASLLQSEGKKVLLAAADTFRAAAIDQLKVWAERAKVDIVSHEEGSDPSAVVFDAVNALRARKADVLIVDTAGRLHNKKNLMNELEKIGRVLARELPEADRETLLVLDGSTGQNALLQAREFRSVAPLTGLVLTKLDGTAKGGVIFPICSELDVPVKFIGVGEGVGDLRYFDAPLFVKALFGEG